MKPIVLSAAKVTSWILRRPVDSHKGKNGHLLVVAGSRGMSGAAVLTALGALRAGAGLVTIATPESERASIAVQLPEALILSLPETPHGVMAESAHETLLAYLQNRSLTALAVGPGLSIAPSVSEVVKSILTHWELPLVLDADGLNNVSLSDIGDYPHIVLTPHVAEMARLLKMEREDVTADRVGVAQNAVSSTTITCILKGHRSVIADRDHVYLNPTGNPAMATGGMGDVLTGIVGAFLAQGMKPLAAACAGAYVHGLAGDLSRESDRGLLASDLANAVPRALRKLGLR